MQLASLQRPTSRRIKVPQAAAAEKHGNRTQAGPQFFRFHNGYGARFKTYLRELIRGDVRPYLVTTERWNRKGCR